MLLIDLVNAKFNGNYCLYNDEIYRYYNSKIEQSHCDVFRNLPIYQIQKTKKKEIFLTAGIIQNEKVVMYLNSGTVKIISRETELDLIIPSKNISVIPSYEEDLVFVFADYQDVYIYNGKGELVFEKKKIIPKFFFPMFVTSEKILVHGYDKFFQPEIKEIKLKN